MMGFFMSNENIYEIPVNDYPEQVQNFEMFGYNVQFTMRFNAVGLSWSFDLYDNRKGEYIVKNEGLSTNQASLFYSELPFVIMVVDNSGLGVESISSSEMGNRFNVLIMSREVYQNAIRQTINFDGWESV